MLGVLEFIESESRAPVLEEPPDEQIETFHYELDPISILEGAGLVIHEEVETEAETTASIPNEKPDGASRFKIHKRLIRPRKME